MTTVSDIVTRAFRKIGVVSSDEPLSADDAQVGLDGFNMMMSGLALGVSDAGHITNTLVDTLAYPLRLEEAIVYALAGRLSDDYPGQPVDARLHYSLLQSYFMNVPTVTMPLSLRRTPTGRRWSNTWGS